jgi:hypothetical protein
VNVSTPFEDFRKALTVASQRDALGIDLSDSKAAHVAGDEALAQALYGDWIRLKALGSDSFSHGRRSAERPSAIHRVEPEMPSPPASSPAPMSTVNPPKQGLGCGGIGCLSIIALVIIGVIFGNLNGASSGGLPDSCYDAQNARSIANSANDEVSRSTATLQYAVKKAKCEDAGGLVP